MVRYKLNMNLGFWGKINRPFMVLAPMANVTDWAFRQVIIEAGTSTGLSVNKPDVFYTEFLSCDGIVYDKERFKKEMYFEENERPIVIQFFGSKPDNFYKCAQLAVELGFDGVDINMGCPDKAVEKQKAGAALMKNPELAKKIIEETIRGAGSLPVSVKTRLGYNNIESDTWVKGLLETDIATLVVHGRTRKEMSKVPAHWDELGKISQMANGSGKIIVGNGDVTSIEDAQKKAKDFGLDGIMVGRGIFANPWFFSGRESGTPEERVGLLLKHLANFEKLWGQNKNFDTMKRFFKIYINGPRFAGRMSPEALATAQGFGEASWDGAKELRARLMNCKNSKEAISILDPALEKFSLDIAEGKNLSRAGLT